MGIEKKLVTKVASSLKKICKTVLKGKKYANEIVLFEKFYVLIYIILEQH